jgi:hypothetical protein
MLLKGLFAKGVYQHNERGWGWKVESYLCDASKEVQAKKL